VHHYQTKNNNEGPNDLGMTKISDLINNKQRRQLCTLIVGREKR
jgi:hypothetical protein